MQKLFEWTIFTTQVLRNSKFLLINRVFVKSRIGIFEDFNTAMTSFLYAKNFVSKFTVAYQLGKLPILYRTALQSSHQ